MNSTVNALVTLESSVSHIGDTVGIDAEFNRIKVTLPDGQMKRIPFISGNSLRGQLRDAAVLYMLDRLNLTGLPLASFYMLFSGGSLTKAGGTASRLDDIRTLRHLIPLVSLWGSAVENRILPGKLKIGMMIPCALETSHMLHDSFVDHCQHSVYEMMDNQSYTRFDDAKDVRLEAYFIRNEHDNEAPQQMRYNVETMIAGTRLYWHFAFERASELEIAVFISALRGWSTYPSLGGKSAVGHGLCRVEMDNGWLVSQHETNLPDIAAYDTHLDQYTDAIRSLLYEHIPST